MNIKPSLVITSIASPNQILRDYARNCSERNFDFILIGDVPSPDNFQIDGCNFYSIQDQKKLPYKLATLLPERHYSRKNLGYLLAANSPWIVETDDDNLPHAEFWAARSPHFDAQQPLQKGWTNVYRYFSDTNIWPRGFPLEKIQQAIPALNDELRLFCPIQQGLADLNPDVDAIYRLVNPLPQNFNKRSAIALPNGNWCPFNSQNTTWFPEAYLLLYLPSYCSFRMTDIWRSFVTQRIAWTCGWPILFHNATVWQERNEHNLLRDFSDEISGYLNNANIAEKLEQLDLPSGPENIAANLLTCYSTLIEMGLIKEEEMILLQAWIDDWRSIQKN